MTDHPKTSDAVRAIISDALDRGVSSFALGKGERGFLMEHERNAVADEILFALSNAGLAVQDTAHVSGLERRLSQIELRMSCQAEDEGLWFVAVTAAEAYLQQELRRLHEIIEGKTSAECAEEAMAAAFHPSQLETKCD